MKRTALAILALLLMITACGKDTTEPEVTKNDGHAFLFKPPAGAPTVTSVNVAGSFNDWSTTARAMVKQTDGTWKASIVLAKGSYQYKYVINGDTWVQNMCNDATWGDPAKGGKVDPNVASCVDDGFGGQNAVLVVQ